MCSDKWHTEGKSHFPGPVGNSLANAAQDVIGLCCYEGILLAHVQLGVHQDPQGPFLQSCFPTGQHPAHIASGRFSIPSAGLGIWFCWTFVELHEILVSPYHQPVKSLSGAPLQDTNLSTWFGIDQKLAESALCPVVQVTNKDIEYYWPQYWSLRDAMSNQLLNLALAWLIIAFVA